MMALAEYLESLEVLIEAEDIAAVETDALEHAVAVEQAMVKNGDLRLGGHRHIFHPR